MGPLIVNFGPFSSSSVAMAARGLQGGDRWVRLHEQSLEFHPRFFPVFEEKREN